MSKVERVGRFRECPFCGGRGEARRIEGKGRAVRVVCVVCLSQGSVKFTEAAAVAAWQRREL